MNKSLKLALTIIFVIFIIGIFHENSEISNVLKKGIGFTLVSISALLIIMSIFAWAVEWRDKFICIYWAGAIFSLGFGFEQGGLTYGLMYLGGFLVISSIYLYGIMHIELAILLIIIGAITSILGIGLFISADEHPSMAILNKPTEQNQDPPPEESSDTKIFNKNQCWQVIVIASSKPEGTVGVMPLKIELGFVFAKSKAEATEKANPRFDKWEKENPNLNYIWHKTLNHFQEQIIN